MKIFKIKDKENKTAMKGDVDTSAQKRFFKYKRLKFEKKINKNFS